jgi:hypothetical protein
MKATALKLFSGAVRTHLNALLAPKSIETASWEEVNEAMINSKYGTREDPTFLLPKLFSSDLRQVKKHGLLNTAQHLASISYKLGEICGWMPNWMKCSVLLHSLHKDIAQLVSVPTAAGRVPPEQEGNFMKLIVT